MPNPFAPHYDNSVRYVGPAAVLSDDDRNADDTAQVVSTQWYYAQGNPYDSNIFRDGPVEYSDQVHGDAGGGDLTPAGEIHVPAGYEEIHVITRTLVQQFGDGNLFGYVNVHPDNEGGNDGDMIDAIPCTINGMNYQDHAFTNLVPTLSYTVFLTAANQTGTLHARRFLSEFYVEAIIDQEITPLPPTFIDAIGTDDDTYTIPELMGAQYYVDGNPTDAGTYPGSGTVTVTVTPEVGYTFTDGSVTSWTFTWESILGQLGETRRTFYNT